MSAESDSCIVKQLMFSFATPVVNLAYTSDTLDVHNLPAVPHHMRAMPLFSQFRQIYGLTQKNRLDKRGSGWGVLFKVFVANRGLFITRAVFLSRPSPFRTNADALANPSSQNLFLLF